MFESLSFKRGPTNIPQHIHLRIESPDEKKMQFYSVTVQIIAKLGGLRWILYHHRILSFLFFTTAFWSSSMISMAVAWLAISTYLAPPPPPKGKMEPGLTVKRERSGSDAFDPTSLEDLSDTSRTFPTLGRQAPLHFSGRRRDIKNEEEEGANEDDMLRQPLAAEADDEEEEEEYDEVSQGTSGFRDSGIGTGLDDERLASVQRRRKGLMERRDGGV